VIGKPHGLTQRPVNEGSQPEDLMVKALKATPAAQRARYSPGSWDRADRYKFLRSIKRLSSIPSCWYSYAFLLLVDS